MRCWILEKGKGGSKYIAEGVNAATYYRWERELLEQLKLSKKKLLGRFSEQVRLSRSWTS